MPHIKSCYKVEDRLISILPPYSSPATLLVGDRIPCHGNTIAHQPTQLITLNLNRHAWVEGLYVNQNDLHRVQRYKNLDGSYKNDFDKTQFLEWIKEIEENTAICDMEHKDLGKGVFVPSGKRVSKGTFIPSSGIIKLDPTKEELATKVHCSALQNLNSPTKPIYGFIDPAQKGGILDLINHAPDKDELAHFNFQDSSIKDRVATSNLKSIIKFYNGYAIMGLEAFESIDGGEHGQQLHWSYARSCEYLEKDTSKSVSPVLLLFDKRVGHNGEVINPSSYSLRTINIFIDTGDAMLRSIATLTRWELMEDSQVAGFLVVKSYDGSQTNELLIEKHFLQTYLNNNPIADRIILDAG